MQRKLARAKRGSHNRRKALRAVQRQQAHIAAQRAGFLHQLSADLVRQHDRDHNAALNILRRAGWDTPVPENVAPLFAASRDEQGQASVRSPRL